MTVVVLTKLPPQVDRNAFDEVSRQVNAAGNPPEGLIIHTATEVDGRFEIVDVWESADHFHRFFESRVAPVIGPAMQRMGMGPESATQPEIREAFDIVRGR